MPRYDIKTMSRRPAVLSNPPWHRAGFLHCQHRAPQVHAAPLSDLAMSSALHAPHSCCCAVAVALVQMTFLGSAGRVTGGTCTDSAVLSKATGLVGAGPDVDVEARGILLT